MKQLTAKTPEQVKEWIEAHAHHIASAEGPPAAPTHLMLQGREHRLRIPKAVHLQCKLVPSEHDDSRIFVWEKSQPLDALDKRMNADPNPWTPMSAPIDVKHLGKLAEELNEAGQATARCLIQGIDEVEPTTKYPNRLWLEDELADVLANVELVIEHFKLDKSRIAVRSGRKQSYLRRWHAFRG